MRLLVLSSLILILFQDLFAGQQKYYFYDPQKNYGSEVMFNPGTVFLNGGFDVLRNGQKSKVVWDQPYSNGLKNVWYNITHPIQQVEAFGWKRFLTSEIFPLSTDAERLQYFPNYGNHLIGHGMKFIRLAEWYDSHGIKFPHLSAGLTAFGYAYLNEIVENGHHDGVDVDPIADMIFFNPLGMLLFSTTWAKKFFSETIPLYDWSLQPVYNPLNGHLENAGEQYVLNYPLTDKYTIFFYWGTSGLLGLSYNVSGKDNISFGAGAIVNKLIDRKLVKSKTFAKYVAPETIDGAVGAFYDRDHSLLASLIITGPVYYNARMNVYPGWLKFNNFSSGLFVGLGELDKIQVGMTFIAIPIGIDLAVQ